MTEMTGARLRTRIDLGLGLAIAILLLLTAVRLAGLAFSRTDLFMDEAQYWSWSHELAWGYFSKPPLIAWIIRLAEAVCGNGEACIRAASPTLYFATCLTVYFTARTVYGTVAGFWAALLMSLGTGLIFSSRIISTDVPLALFWALALLAYVKLLERESWWWTLALGISLGLGLLAKYAMIYFLLGMLLAAVLDRKGYTVLCSRQVWVAFGIAMLIVTPHLIWLLQHDWVALRNVAVTAQTDAGVAFNPLSALAFLAAQFVVFGPVIFAILLYAIGKISLPEEVPGTRIMLAFAIPPLAIISLVALLSRANANWAAMSGVSSTILAAALLIHHKAWRWLTFCLVLGAVAQVTAIFADAMANRISIPFVPAGQSDLYRRTLGSRALADQVGIFADRSGANTIVGEDRRTVAALLYYRRNAQQQVLAWPSSTVPQFDMTRPLTEAAQEPILLITECPFQKRLSAQYTTIEQLGEIRAPTGPTSSLYHAVFRLKGAKAVITPLSKCVPE
jgi:4-amino-4-deoxy-L-arabinose transferase-like glycosyltransferase